MTLLKRQIFGSKKANDYLPSDQAIYTWKDVVEPGLARLNGNDDILPQDWVKHIGPKVAQSIHLAEHRDLMRWYLRSSFAADKATFPKALQAISWIPILSDDVKRRGIDEFVGKDYARWRNKIQGAAQNDRDKRHKEAKAELPLIDVIQPAVDSLQRYDSIQPAFAPNPASRYWAEAVFAASQNKHDIAAEALEKFKDQLSPSALTAPLLSHILRSDKWQGAAHKERLQIFTKSCPIGLGMRTLQKLP